MELFTSLWLAIIVASIAVWFASFLVWAVLPIHNKDFDKLPNEDVVVSAVKAQGVSCGVFMFPAFMGHKDANKPENRKRYEEGPNGLLTILPKANMGKNMVLTFLVFLVVSTLIACVGAMTLERGADFGRVLRVLGTVGVLSYSFAFIPNGIWFGSKPRAIVNCILDGVAYGLLTGVVFALLWPGAAAG